MSFLRYGLGNFRCCIWKEKFSSVYQSTLAWHGQVSCFSDESPKIHGCRNKFRGCPECTDIVWRNNLHARKCCWVVAWLYLDLGISRTEKCEQEDWAAVSASDQAQSVSHRTDKTSLASRSVHHGTFPDVYFYTHSLQRPHEQRPMASRREQVSALFFVAWTQRRLTECFPWATEGPNPSKETLTFKKELFLQTTSGSLPAGLKQKFFTNK